ncbi:hypothetical protein CEXT_123421 [Caerostris extrusa]|uniref:Uncharacterized protein n=1 Tax=Caerostris extrusa TaxID=172846 RepID=A0AAV4MRS5_CAEEX|nr:hypothetical protein CEXT_123421 [Caerostris extrusa]
MSIKPLIQLSLTLKHASFYLNDMTQTVREIYSNSTEHDLSNHFDNYSFDLEWDLKDSIDSQDTDEICLTLALNTRVIP